MLIDDEKAIGKLISTFMSEAGYVLHQEESGPSTLTYYQEHWKEIDLIILDMIMPVMDGATVYRAMKAINPTLRVLLICGYSINGAPLNLLEEGGEGSSSEPLPEG